jgi:hypothetical protein
MEDKGEISAQSSPAPAEVVEGEVVTAPKA